GSGTIPLEACLQGRHGIGSDLSPFAYTLTAGKIAFPACDRVDACVDALEAGIAHPEQVPSVPGELEAFYHPRTLAEIVSARAIVLEALYSAGWGEGVGAWAFVGSAILHLLHGNRPYALSRRSHNIIPIPPK